MSGNTYAAFDRDDGLMEVRQIVEELLSDIGKRFRTVATATGSYLLATIVLLAVHFSGYLIYFGRDLATLLDATSVLRFSFSAFLFVGAFVSILRLITTLVFFAVRSRHVSKFLLLIGSLFLLGSRLEIIEERRLQELVVQGIGYVSGLIAFLFFYLGNSWIVVMLGVISVFVAILLMVSVARSIFSQRSFMEELQIFDHKSFGLALAVVLVGIAGNLRGSYVSKSQYYSFHLLSPGADESKLSETADNVSEEICTANVDFSGVIILMGSNGYFLFERKIGRTIFVPFEVGRIVCIEERLNWNFRLLS